MEFWRITCPSYPGGDYDAVFINGVLEHPYGLPGVECTACGETWSGSRTLPFRLPTQLTRRKELKDGWPISSVDHQALRQELEAALAEEGHQIKLQPGDRFQPAYVRLPTFPEADFLWPGLGAIVSARAREVLTGSGVTGVRFCKVLWGKIGERRPVLPAPIPRGGEPESLLTQMPTYVGNQPAPDYFEMVVVAESKLPPGVKSRRVCPSCGREDLDTKKRVLEVLPKQWNGEGVFTLATTLYTIVTSEVQDLLERAQVSNIRFVRLPISGD